MIANNILTHVAIVALSLGIIFTYIKPTFTSIAQTQDDIGVYQSEREKVSQVNAKLSALAQSIDNISIADQRKLLTYMPDSVDTIAVPRDIKIIADTTGVLLRQISYQGIKDPVVTEEATAVDASQPEGHIFLVSFEGSYGQIKEMLLMLEQNEYPLEVHDLSIQKTEGGFLSVEMQLITYDHLSTASTI